MSIDAAELISVAFVRRLVTRRKDDSIPSAESAIAAGAGSAAAACEGAKSSPRPFALFVATQAETCAQRTLVSVPKGKTDPLSRYRDMGQRISAKVLVVGLDRAGKSLVVRALAGPRLAAGKHDVVLPTASLERTDVGRRGVSWTFLELASHSVPEGRELMQPWLAAASACVFVVDASDSLRLAEMSQAFSAAWDDTASKRLPMLVVCNRGKPITEQDCAVPGDLAGGVDPVTALELLPPGGRGELDADTTSRLLRLGSRSDGRPVQVLEVNVLTGGGCDAALEWLRIHVGAT